MNTEDGLLLVHDFPNPFIPSESLPAINWRGSWVIVTPQSSSAPSAPVAMQNVPVMNQPNSAPLPPSITSSPSEATSLPSPEPQSPIPLPAETPDPIPHHPTEEPLQADLFQTENPPEVKPIVSHLSRPAQNPLPAPRDFNSRRYGTVNAMSTMPRWSETPTVPSASSSDSYPPSSRSSDRGPPINNKNRRRPGAELMPRHGRTTNGLHENSDLHAPPAKRIAPAQIDSSPQASSRRASLRSSSTSGNQPQGSRNGAHIASPSRSTTVAAIATPSADLYNPLEPIETSARVETTSTPSAPAIAFSDLPRELFDHDELERTIASNAGPPNIGPTLVVTVKRDGARGILPVEVALSASISGLKLKLRALTGLLIREQRLILGKLFLHPDLKVSSLKDEIHNGKHIVLHKRSDQWRIDVETIDGRIATFDFGPKDYVADLEDAVQEKLFNGVARRFHLLNGGHRLRRPNTLSESGIKSGHKVRVILSSSQ